MPWYAEDMEGIYFWFGILVASIFFLVQSSRYFTRAAENIGAFFGVPPFIIGVTIVAVGTSLPELLSSIVAVLQNASEIVVGNVVGSNITNILLVAGLAAIVGRNVRFSHELIHVDLPLFITSAFLLSVMVWDGYFSLFEAILSLFCVFIYVLYTIRSEMRYEDPNIEREMEDSLKDLQKKKIRMGLNILLMLVSCVGLYFSAQYTVESVIQISEMLDIGKVVIASTVVALGTSLPEVMVAIVAARKGKAEMALGNVLGSSIFNSYLVMGIPALIAPLPVPLTILSYGVPMMAIASLLFFFFTQDKEISRWEGWMLIIFYFFYVGSLFGWGR